VKAPSAVLACVIFALCLFAHEARAESADEVRADALFREGMQKFDAGEIRSACEAFTESLRLDPKLGTLLNLALCHEREGKTATAWLEYTHGAAWATQNGQKERREFANQHAITLEGQLSRVLLHLPPARELSSVEIDGEPLPEPRWYLPMYLDPGEHTIAVSAPGKQRRTIKVGVSREPTAQIVPVPALADVELPPPPPPRKPPALPPSNARRVAGFVVGGVGLAGLAMGSVLGVLTIQKRDEIGAHCTTGATSTECDALGAQLHGDAQTLGTWSTVSFAAGAAAVAAGALLVITAPKRGPEVHAFIGPRGAVLGGVF
jgi:hypothetical protein